MFLCKQLHFTEAKNGTKADLFCKSCNKFIQKLDFTRFYLHKNGSWYYKKWDAKSIEKLNNARKYARVRKCKAKKRLVQNGL